MMALRLSTVVCLAVALSFAAVAAPGPSADPQRQAQIEAAIERLGSADPAAREEATRFLWAAGDDAAAALKEAASGEDAEIARRAGEILRNLQYGIRPDTPPVIVELLNLYRQEDRNNVQAAVVGLASRGTVGIRVLSRLWREEQQPWKRALLSQRLAERARTAAALLMADGLAGSPGGGSPGGAADTVLPLLEAAAEAAAGPGEQSMRDLTAFLMLRGGGALDDRVAQLKPLVGAPLAPAAAGPEQGAASAKARSAALLAYLCRARSDLTAARWAAAQSGDDGMVEALLVESGDWKELAKRKDAAASASLSQAPDLEAFGYAAAFHRMAGDEAGAEKWVEQMIAHANKRPDESWLAAEALFLNDRPDEGMAVLLKHHNDGPASELLSHRMQFKELFDLAAEARQQNRSEAAKVEARVAAAKYLLGDANGAKEILDRLVAQNEKDKDFSLYIALADAASAMRQPKVAEDCAVSALAVARPMDDVADLLEQAGLAPGERASRWWSLMRQKYREPVRLTFERLAKLMRGQLAAGEMESLARAAAEDVTRVQASDRDEWLAEVGQTLVAAGQRDSARMFFSRLNGPPAPATPVPMAFVRLGDLEAEDERWEQAATLYGRAWEMDRTRPLPLLLRGRALSRAGAEKPGRELIDLAHLMPLADEVERHELMAELEKRGLADDARRERQVILRTAAFGSWHLSDALRRAGDEAYEKGDYAAAADLWDRAFLDNQSKATRFAQAWANFAMPSLIHRARALGLMRAGDMPAAMKEAELSMRYTPGDADGLIALVTELDKLGKKKEADELYQRYTAPYRALCAKYADSGQCHNQLAWAEARCKRDLDDALSHAQRATTLEPDNTASLDTLAETHFQRNEFQKAIEIINRCIEMEPKDKHHQQQLARFAKALAGQK